MLENLDPVTAIRLIMPLAALTGSFLIYRASGAVGGRLGLRLKVLAVATLFLALYGTVAAAMNAGIQLFSYRDGAWSVVHAIIHLTYTTAMLIGFASIYHFTRGDLE